MVPFSLDRETKVGDGARGTFSCDILQRNSTFESFVGIGTRKRNLKADLILLSSTPLFPFPILLVHFFLTFRTIDQENNLLPRVLWQTQPFFISSVLCFFLVLHRYSVFKILTSHRTDLMQ